MVFGLIAAVVLARGSVLKAIAMVCLGILLGLIGTDVNSGVIRFAFGWPELADGLGFVALAMAFFGITDVIFNLEHKEKQEVFTSRIGSVLPTAQDVRTCIGSIARGTALGAILGILPGGGALLASFAAYMVEKKVARPPRMFGQGDIRGVAAPESANNAGAQTSFIPMLTLGIPGNAVMALMIGAMTIHGIQPGPQVMTERPQLFWGMVASMWIGNLMLLVINLPLIGIWVQLLKVPYRFLYLSILLFCAIGVYTIGNSSFSVLLAAVFGVLGYVFARLDCEPAPMILGFVLGPLMEDNLRRAMRISSGDPMIFFNRPISLGLLVAAVVLLVLVALPAIRNKREEAFQE
jgi:TctA family transporter